MNILLCNNRHFVSGGPERYMFSVTDLLEKRGHKVVPFSLDYSENRETVYSRYFADPPLGAENIYYDDAAPSLRQQMRLFCRTVYNLDAGRKLKEVITRERIDLVYALQVVNFLYSAVIDRSWRMGIPVVARFSDFQLLCPAYTFCRDGNVCEDCRRGYFHAVMKRCLKNSYGVTLARVLAMYAYKLLRIQEKIDVIVAPSKFLRDKLTEFGIDGTKVVNIPSYIKADDYMPSYDPGDYVLYVGNIQRYKGVEVLVRAFRNIDRTVRLKIVGRSNDGEDKRLMALVRDEGIGNVEFLGFKSGEELKTLYQNAMFVVVPSIWYENMPNVILEAMAYGKPVVGSNIGSIPELIDDRTDGLCFEPSSVDDLTEKTRYLLDNRDLIGRMGRMARRKVEQRYNSDLHYDRLMKVYQQALAKRRNR